MKTWGMLGVLAWFTVVPACVGDDPVGGAPAPTPTDGGLLGQDAAPDPDPNASSSSSGNPDGAAGCAESVCLDDTRVARCAGGVATTIACGIGCSAGRCRTFDPVGPATPADLELGTAGLRLLRLDGALLDSATGQIVAGGNVVRAANTSPGSGFEEIVDGVGFRVVDGIAVLRALSIDIVTAQTTGANRLVVVAVDEIRVTGEWRVDCGTLGGIAGGSTGTDAPGPHGGKTQDGDYVGDDSPPGGGGGGNVGRGGTGAPSDTSSTNASGPGGAGAAADFSLLRGGGGGAGGMRNNADVASTSVGGSGGGAVQLVAGARIQVGRPGQTGELSSGINVGGCGGAAGRNNDNNSSSSPKVAGAGGGAGGSLILEAPLVVGHAGGGIAANGGGGSSSAISGDASFARGHDALIATTPASGGPTGGCSAGGGAGAAGTTVDGAPGKGEAVTCATQIKGGGGGGAAGYIAVRSYRGAATLDPAFVVSPSAPAAFQQTTLDGVQ